jgi:hypothetical protein
MRRSFPAVVVLLVLAAACGDDAADTTSTTSTVPPPTTTVAPTTVPTTTPPPPITTTTVEGTTTTAAGVLYSVALNGLFPDPLPGSDQAHGSGCAPPGDGLPDGVWFGFAEGADDGAVTFDLACFWTGAAAQAEAAADGEEAFDFYIRNINPKTFAVPLDLGGTAYWIDASGSDTTPKPIAMTAWPVGGGYTPCPGEFCAVWLFVNEGVATELVEQYLP